MNHADLFKTSDVVRKCIVRKKVEFSTALELYDQTTDEFILACVYCTEMSPMMILTTLQNAHLRRFDELCCNINLRQFVGKMIPDWVSGCHFKLTKFQGTEVCEIRIKQQILISAPVAFTAAILNEDAEEDESTSPKDRQVSANGANRGPSERSESAAACTSGIFACFGDGSSCGPSQLTTKESGVSTKRTDSSGTVTSSTSPRYVGLSGSADGSSHHHIATKPPKWNTELRQYTQNYGGRVKIASQKNFVATFVAQAGDPTYHYETAAQDHNIDTMCIRHGKVRSLFLVPSFITVIILYCLRYRPTRSFWISSIRSDLQLLLQLLPRFKYHNHSNHIFDPPPPGQSYLFRFVRFAMIMSISHVTVRV